MACLHIHTFKKVQSEASERKEAFCHFWGVHQHARDGYLYDGIYL